MGGGALGTHASPIAKFDSLEPTNYFGISDAIYNLGGTGYEEDFDDHYFPRPDMGKISHLCLEALEVEELEGAGSIPTASNNATLPLGILHIFNHPLITLQKPLLYLTSLFITGRGEVEASLVLSFEVSVEFVGVEGSSLPSFMILASSISLAPILVTATISLTISAVPAIEMMTTLPTLASIVLAHPPLF